MDEQTTVTVDLTVEVDDAELSLATADLEDAVAELVGPGVSGALRVDVRRSDGAAGADAAGEVPPDDPTNVVETTTDEAAEHPVSDEGDDAGTPGPAPPRPDAGDAPEGAHSKARFEVYEDRSGQFRWRLVHDNGNVIADSGEGYATWGGAENGLRSVKRNAPGAPVERL